MNFQEIKSKLEELEITPEQLACQEFDDNEQDVDDVVFKETFGEIEEVAQEGGEGEGDEWFTVILFKEHGVYIRIDAYYSSIDGTDFEDSEFLEVTPREKTITVYQTEEEKAEEEAA